MADAYKCQNCGEVVERPRNCPSCGENAMRPTRVPESALGTQGDGGQASAETEPPGPDDAETTADSRPGNRTGTDEGVATDGQATDRARRDGRRATDSGGLVAWLKSLF